MCFEKLVRRAVEKQTKSFKIHEICIVPKELKNEHYSQDTCHLQHFNFGIFSFELTSVFHQLLPYSVCKAQMIKGMLAASIMHHEINEHELYYDLAFMLLKEFREPLISFQWTYS